MLYAVRGSQGKKMLVAQLQLFSLCKVHTYLLFLSLGARDKDPRPRRDQDHVFLSVQTRAALSPIFSESYLSR